MTIGLKYKLFATLLGVVGAVVVGMYLLMQWSFDRGFLKYVNTLEVQRLEALAANLEEAYAQNGGWDFLRDDRSRWRQILRASLPEEIPDQLSPAVPGPRRELAPAHKGRRHPRGEAFFARRVVLLDAQRQAIFAPAEYSADISLQSLRKDGLVVGYLGMVPLPHLGAAHQLEFAAEQRQAFLLIAVVMTVAAALVALPLAGRMARRVRGLAAGTRQLAAGRYAVRVPVRTSDELGQLARDFNTLALTLEKNEQVRRQWIADISHELRTPLAVLRAEIEAIQDGIRPTDAGSVASLHGEVMRLSRLVDDLYQLSLSDLGALSYRKAMVDLGEILAAACEEYRGEFAQHGLALIVRLPPESLDLQADGERLRQLFANLLHNSLKYTDSGGRLEVELGQADDQVVIDFRDTAPGVPEADLERLFDRLYRVDASRSRDTGGAGLGLSICRNIVEAHQGTIEGLPSPLGGLRIRVRLPVAGGGG